MANLIPVLSPDHARAIGCLLFRGKQGWECFDDYEISLGIFPTADEAAEALLTAARIREPTTIDRTTRGRAS
jgi:hypothetical protein